MRCRPAIPARQGQCPAGQAFLQERGHFTKNRTPPGRSWLTTALPTVQLKYTSTGTTLPHRELLTESQRLSLQTPASDERGMVRHYTLSSEDLALINRRRGDPNRLGCALILCYLRFPGRILQQGEQPPAALCAFVAEQLSLAARRWCMNRCKRAR